MKKIIIVCIVVLMSGCSNNSPIDYGINFSLIKKGNLSGSEGITESNLVIKDVTTWNSLLNKIVSIGNPIEDFTETDIDFNRFQVIAVFHKVQFGGGHTLEIKKIIENNLNLIVIVEKTGYEGINTSIEQRFHIIKILKTDKNIVFE